MQVTSSAFLEDLQSSVIENRPIRIKVFNLGENLGMDFAYFDHYLILKKWFPTVTIHLYRSNVDETNCIGLENHRGKAILPVDRLEMAVVKQRYGNGQDWCQKLNNRDYSIFTDEFRSIEGYHYVWGIGYGSAACWQEQYLTSTKHLSSGAVREAISSTKAAKQLSEAYQPIYVGKYTDSIQPWERTALEYITLGAKEYPFRFTEELRQQVEADRYKDYIRVGLRWPDHVRWYYSVDRQFEVLHEILSKIRAAGKPVKMIFTLKDFEVGNNFNRGQTIDKLKRLQEACDECLFTYSWTVGPYRPRPSESAELAKLSAAGIHRVRKVDIWEDLLIASSCKAYLSDPGGFAEIICMLRRPETTFLFPVSFGHSGTYVTLNRENTPVNLKVNRVVAEQFYKCSAVLSAPDDPEGYRTLHWNMQYLEDCRQIGDNNHGDDWKHFEAAQNTVFKDWYYATKDTLVSSVVAEMVK